MPHHDVRYVDLRRPPERDAVAVTLRVFREDEYFQFVEAIASGIALAVQRQWNVIQDRFWAWFAQEAVEELKVLISRGELPLEDPTKAVIIQPSVERVMRRAEAATIDALREDNVIASFEL